MIEKELSHLHLVINVNHIGCVTSRDLSLFHFVRDLLAKSKN